MAMVAHGRADEIDEATDDARLGRSLIANGKLL
jgi:hypothetical protein